MKSLTLTLPPELVTEMRLEDGEAWEVISLIRSLLRDRHKIEAEWHDIGQKRLELLRDGYLLGCEHRDPTMVDQVVEMWLSRDVKFTRRVA